MMLLHWFTRNWADTDEPGDAALVPLVLAVPPAEAVARVEAAIRSLKLWHIEKVDAAGGRIQATRRTPLWGFVDDISLRLEAMPGGTRVHARSRSRVGLADFGQNRRNLLELFARLRQP
jgi:uncharacterized protein (DUF1499 family)